jgi:CTP:molybdopterin cytidylyltransferase MocA
MIIPVKIYKNLIKNDDLLSDKGLKNLILDAGFDIVRVSSSSGILKDFDTKEDFN